jgi:hypothetical protein
MSTPSIASPPSTFAQLRRRCGLASVRIVASVITFTAAAVYEALHLTALTDSDIWWHLRTGLWILQNHALPRSGLFSQFVSLGWSEASWGFDVLTAGLYRMCGLAGLPILLLLWQVAIAVALFSLARGSGKNFWPAAILVIVAQCSIAPVSPRPALCSIVLLAIELRLLLDVRRSGHTRDLFWLPLIFVVWANLDRQFSYGLLALGIFCLVVLVEQLGRASGIEWFATGLPDISLGGVGAVAGASLLATFLSPYGYRLHQLIWQSATNSAADRYFREFHALRFRQPQDYILMLLGMTAFFALGRRRSRDPFLVLLLIVSAAISFRLQRDSWLVVVGAVAIIGNSIAQNESTVILRTWMREKFVTAALTLAVVIAVSVQFPQPAALRSKVSQTFPVRAADYIRQNRLSQPLFNTYAWGGFLTWYLPEYPVYIDGRADLYGDDVKIPYFKLMQAEIPLQSHPGFAQAQTILFEADSPLAQALETLPGFRVAYKDEQALVLVRAD